MICPSCRAENQAGAEVCFTCRSVLSAITQGSLVASRYEIQGFLGRGGMGAVYSARDRLLDETVAVKILRADVAGTPEMAERLRREIKLARRVSHPNVCRIHEYGEDASVRFISMELVEGTSLRQRLEREGPLSPERACEVAAQVADGLEAIHAAGVVHRDVKPPNIMLDVEGRVRLMDFGIAKRLAGAGDPSTSYVVGSPEYMSPEQGRGRRVDARSDIYSLGIVLFELLTGRVPFLGDSPVATLLMHVEQPPPLQAPQLSQVPESLRGILRRSLAKDPEARFPSAREMGVALRRASGGGAATASGQGRAGRPPERRRVLLAALAALGLAVVAVRWAGGPQPPRDDRAAAASDARSPVVTAPPDVPSQRTPERPAERDIARPRLPVAQSPTPRPAPAQPPSASVPSEAARRPVEETSLATPAPSPPPSTAASGPAASPASPAPLASPPAAQPERTVSTAEPGMLVVAVSPWADVAVDGAHVGQTPLRAIALPPGPHSVLLTHPDFQPYPRRVTIRPGETVRLLVDLRTDGVRKRPR